jgi:hypothetical protein
VIRELFAMLLTELADIAYVRELSDADQRVLIVRARIGEEQIEEAVWLRFAADGLIDEMTAFVRPLTGLTAMAALGARSS